MLIVQKIFPQLLEGFVATPGVHLGAAFEIDVSAYELDEADGPTKPNAANSGVVVVAQAPPQLTMTLEMELPD